MSGGAYNYICYKLSEIELEHTDTNPRRAAFAKLLKLVGEAMHDIEWVDSCDYGPGDENEAIDKVFKFLSTDEQTVIKARAYDQMIKRLKEITDYEPTGP